MQKRLHNLLQKSAVFTGTIHVELLIRHWSSHKMIQELLLLACVMELLNNFAHRPIMPVERVVCVVLRDSSIGVTAVQWDSCRESGPLAQSFNKEPELLSINGARRIQRSSSPPHWHQPLCPRPYSDPSCLLKHITRPHREHKALTEAFSWWNVRDGGVETIECQSN